MRRSRNVAIRRRDEIDALRRQRDFPSQEIDHDDAEECQQHKASNCADQRRNRGKYEHVPSNVFSKDGISDPERCAIHKPEHIHPATGGARRKKESEDQRDWNRDFHERRGDVHRWELGAHSPEHGHSRRTTSRETYIEREKHVGDHAGDHEQQELRR